MTRLLFAVTNDLNSDQRMLRICSSLQAAGYAVQLVGRQLPNSRPLTQRSFVQHRMRLFFLKGPLFYLEYNLRLFFYALGSSVNAYGAVDLDTLPAMRLAALLRSKVLVYDAHEIFTEVPELQHSAIKKRIWSLAERLFLPGVKHAYTVNHSLAAWYEQRYPLRMQVVRNMPFQQRDKTAKPSGRYLLYQGALNEGRGLEPLIAAMRHLPMPLWIAGKGDLEADLRALVVKAGLQEQVKFLGQLDPEALREVTLGAWLGVNLLESKSLNYYYSLANKFFDYAQCQLPQLCMNFPEYQHYNQQFEVAVLIDELDPAQLAREILQLHSHPERYQHLQANCVLAAENWVWEKEEPVLLDLYKHALRR
jgi:glycosyltransferase involved in cell wall biosynthesis